VIRTEHSLHFPGRGSALYAPLVEGPATALSDRVICVSDAVRASHASRMPGLASRFVTIVNGIPDLGAVRARAEVRAEIGVPSDAPMAFTAGSMTPAKAQHVMVEAFARMSARVPEARLVIAGDGALRADLERRIAALGIGERVKLLGARSDVPDLLGAADLAVVTSDWEARQLFAQEALRAGVPLVATAVGGLPELVGTAADLVPPNDLDAFDAAVRRLLDDRGARADLARRGLARAAGWPSEAETAAQVAALYTELTRVNAP